MNPDHKIIISLVLYKSSLDQLRRCLNSLNSCNIPQDIYLIDNSPTNCLSSILLDFPHCNYVHNPANPGYGAGHNIALKESIKQGVGYHLVINSDVFFEGDILSPMIDHMTKYENTGLLMPKVLNVDGSTQYLCKLVPRPFDLIFRMLFRSSSDSVQNQSFELRNSGYNKIMFVPYLSGCFMLLRVSALRDIGLFDERFFMYPEDIDLTRRIAWKYDTLFFPSVSVVHEHGAASRKSFKMLYIHAYNIVKYFNKWGWFIDSSRDSLNEKTLSQFP